MEQFAVRNVEGDDRLQMSFNFVLENKSRVFNLDRSKTEVLNTTLTRIAANIEKHFFKKKKKKVKQYNPSSSASACALETQSQEDLNLIKVVDVCLTHDGEKVSKDTLNAAAWKSGAQLRICDSAYVVIVNQPTVQSVSLPSCLMANFSVLPTIISEFSSRVDLVWYRGIVKGDCEIVKTVQPHHIIQWSEISRNDQYTPTTEDIGHALKVVCTPKNESIYGFTVEAVGDNVVGAGPGVCPFESRHGFTSEYTPDDGIRVVSYNILADLYADSDYSREFLFPLCPPYALNIDYRVQLIIKEIKGYKGDIVCLQEVDRKVFDYELSRPFAQLGYDGYQKVKDGEVPEGMAIFYRRQKFKLVTKHDIHITDSLQNDAHNADLWTMVASCADLRERLLERNSCLQVALLACVAQPGRHVLVATTHLYFHPEAAHIRLIQGAVCIRHLEKIMKECSQQGLDVVPIFCGDLNSNPHDGLLTFLLDKRIEAGHRAWMSSGEQEHFGGADLSHNLNLYSACGFPEYTNFVVGFQGCLDYILADAERLAVDQVIPMPSHEEVALHTALPNIVFPSDHLAIVCDLKWKNTPNDK